MKCILSRSYGLEYSILFWTAVIFSTLFFICLATFLLLNSIIPYHLHLMFTVGSLGLALTSGSGAYLLRKQWRLKNEKAENQKADFKGT